MSECCLELQPLRDVSKLDQLLRDTISIRRMINIYKYWPMTIIDH